MKVLHPRVEISTALAVHYYQLAADQNYLDGLFHLARCFADGKGVQKSSDKAFHYCKLAADQGHSRAQFVVAKNLLKNKINEDQAVAYLQKILENEDCDKILFASAAYDLGECFEKGVGIRQSLYNAKYYYKISSRRGHKLACKRLGDAYSNGEFGLRVSIETAAKYYRKAGIEPKSRT